MTDILKLARIQIFLILPFVFFKLIRPSVLASNSPEIFKIILLSLPNLFEAITGILVLTGIGLTLNDRINKKYPINAKHIYLLAVLFAGIFVVSQELNFINIRTNTTMDQNDLVFSIIGLIVGYAILLSVKPEINKHEKNNLA